jgi:very-short-patch-repair endonuclease
MKWKLREASRLYRKYIHQERSKRRLIDCVGAFWLFRHGAKIEYQVRLFKSEGWYCIDIAIPHRKVGLEAKGGWRKYYPGDIARDQRLIDRGWRMLRVTEEEIEKDPKGVRKRVRAFITR